MSSRPSRPLAAFVATLALILTSLAAFAVPAAAATSAVPQITSPLDGTYIGGREFQMSGSWRTPDTEDLDVGIFLAGTDTLVGFGQNGQTGAWSADVFFDPDVVAPDSDVALVARASVPDADDWGAPSNTVTVHWGAPFAAPAIDSPTAGLTNAEITAIKGTTPAGTAVALVIDGAPLAPNPCTSPIPRQSDGTWTYTLPAAWGDGDHTVDALAVDCAPSQYGPFSAGPTSVAVTVDRTPPADEIYIDRPAMLAVLQQSPDLTIGGGLRPGPDATSVEGGIVEVWDEMQNPADPMTPFPPVKLGEVATTGSWSFPAHLEPGTHRIGALLRDEAGNVGSSTETLTAVIGGDPVAAIVDPADGAHLNTGTTDIVVEVRQPTLPGGDGEEDPTLFENGVLEIVEDGDVIGSLPVPAEPLAPGDRLTVPDLSFTDGVHTVSGRIVLDFTLLGDDHPTRVFSFELSPVTFEIDTAAPEYAPTITSPRSGYAQVDSALTIQGGWNAAAGAGEELELVLFDGTTEVGSTALTGPTWSIATTAQAGTHRYTAKIRDKALNLSQASNEVVVVIGQPELAAPVITTPADPTSSKLNRRILVGGTGEPGSTVQVRIDGAVVATVPVNGGPAGDQWAAIAFEQYGALADGAHEITASAVHGDRTSVASAATDYTVLPVAPTVIDQPVDRVETTDRLPVFSGTAEPDSSISIWDQGGRFVLSTEVDAAGRWSVTPSADLPMGEITVGTSGVLPVDGEYRILPSAQRTFTIVEVPTSLVISSPADGDTVRPGETVVHLTGGPLLPQTTDLTSRRTLQILSGDDVVGSVLVPAGTTVIDYDVTALLDGAVPSKTHTLTARALDGDGTTVLAVSPPIDVIVDPLPATPVLIAPGSVSSTDRLPVVSGTGETGSTVHVLVDGTEVGTTSVAGGSTWSLALTEKLDFGGRRITAFATTDDGDQSATSDPMDYTVLHAPIEISAPEDDAQLTTQSSEFLVRTDASVYAGEAIEIVEDCEVLATVVAGAFTPGGKTWTLDVPLSDGAHQLTARHVTFEVANAPFDVLAESAPIDVTVAADAPAAPEITTPEPGAYTTDEVPTIGGTAPEGTSVHVELDGAEIGTALVTDGSWQLPGGGALPYDTHEITAFATASDGDVSADSAAVAYTNVAPTISITAPPAGQVTTGQLLVSGAYTAEQGADVRVELYEGAELVATTSPAIDDPDTDGAWEAAVTLSDGTHLLHAVLIEIEAPEGEPIVETRVAESAEVAFVIDSTAPVDAPVIEAPADGTSSTDPRPTISGTAGDDAPTVWVLLDGVEVGIAPIVNGAWELALPADLEEGPHTFTAIAVDEAFNSSPESAPVAYTYDVTAPADPRILSPEDGATVDDGLVTVSGTGEPGSTVTVTTVSTPVQLEGVFALAAVSSGAIGSDEVDENGDWSITATEELADGLHTLTATAVDDAGNVSGADTAELTVDTTVDSDTTPPHVAFTSPEDGFTTGEQTFTAEIEHEAGAWVRTFVDGEPTSAGGVDADDAMTWDVPFLGWGEHTLRVEARDAAGNTAFDELTVTFEKPAPTPDPTALEITSPAEGAEVDEGSVTVAGTGEPGEIVTVTSVSATADGGVAFAAATSEPVAIADDGTWSTTIALAAGAVTLTASSDTGSDTVSITVRAAVEPDPDPTPTPTPAPGPVDDDRGLAATGSDALGLVVPGAALMLLGLVLVLRRRRRA